MKHKALVIGDDTRSFLATVRSLGRGGVEVHVAPYNFDSPALASRYITKVHRLPYYLDGGAAWLGAMESLLRTEGFDLVIPCEERSLLPLYLHRDRLEPLAKLAIPDEASLAAFFDKSQTRALATQCGVPVADGQEITSTTTADTLIEQLGLPLIIKPRHSYDWPELYVRSSAQKLGTHAALTSWLNQHASQDNHYLAEQVFPGSGLGLSVLCASGKVVLAFEHRRVHEEFGSSFYRKSVVADSMRLKAVQDMVAVVSYTGLAMFEFRENPANKKWILLEVNARPWGSLPLPVALGVDFPLALFRLMTEGIVPKDRGYLPERYCRNFFSDFWQVRKQLADRSPFSTAGLSTLFTWLWSFRRVLIGREYSDLRVSDDRAPARRECRDFIAERLDGLRFRLFGPRKASATTRGAKNILFVCQGNICRSPYAEHKLRTLLTGSNISVGSVGMLARNQRPSPPQAIAAAHELGIDLSVHRSKTATDAQIAAADLIVIFDRINEHSLFSRHPVARTKTRWLDINTEIDDPDGKNVATFTHTYRRIDQRLHELHAELVGTGATHA